MSLNFFCEECRETPITESKFGICDDENGTKAYTDNQNEDKWIAKVCNSKKDSVVFTAIDKCVLNDNEYEGVNRCDGMLTTEDKLYLVELKNKINNWKQDGIKQLKSTIQLLKDNNSEELRNYRHKKAYLCNKKRSVFQVIDHEERKRFHDRTGFRLDISAEVIIKD